MEPRPTLYRGERVLVDGIVQPAEVETDGPHIVSVRTGDERGVDAAPGVEVVDVPAGSVLLPGNVDTHVHVNQPGRTKWEGFASATEAAARGGITCLVDMPLNSIPPTTDRGSLALKRAMASRNLHVDVAFWGGAVPGNLGTLRDLWDAGVLGFKCFLLDSGVPEFPPLSAAQLVLAMREVAAFDGLLIVHAEDPDVIAAAPAPPSRRYTDFLGSRPDAAEVEAIATVLRGVRETGCRTHVLHLSSARALPELAAARAEGLPVTVETCPHYLVFDAEHVPDGAAEFKCCPPIRDAGNQKELWQALRDGVVDCVVSDHSPSTVAEKTRGDGDLQQAWGGVSGLQVSFPSVADAAARHGIGLEQVSAWMATAPARIAGLRTKGAIAAGRDADLVWFDPDRPIDVDGNLLAHRNKLSAYDGRTLRGSVWRTVVRGRTVVDGAAPDGGVAEPAARYLSRPVP